MRTGPKVLFDALTPKQARVAAALRNANLDILVTCRHYLHVREILQLFSVPHMCLGQHGRDLREKLLQSSMRQLLLVPLVENRDVVVTFVSPEAARVAVGLAKPLIVMADTPHAVHVNRLVMPLATLVIVPEATPPHLYAKYCPSRIETVPGVFEAMWVTRHTPKPIHRELGLSDYGYVVLRRHERYAAYSKWDLSQLEARLVREIREAGYEVVLIPRYDDDVEWGRSVGAKVLDRTVDFLDLAAYAAAVVTGGATMATEAALLGTPSLSYFPEHYHVFDYLERIGAPIARCVGEECLDAVRRVLAMGRSRPSVPDPTQRIVELIREAAGGGT